MSAPHGTLVVLAALGALSLSGCGGAEARRESHMERGEAYFAEGNFEKARIEFRNVLQITPNDAQARFMSGRSAEKLGNLRDAAGMYQGAIDVDPDHVQARANLGRMFVFGGAPERAMEIIEPGLVAHPDDPDLLTVRGAVRIQKQDRAGAIADATRAIELAPQNESAVALLASLYRQAGETHKAISLLARTLETLPASVDLRQVLANLYIAAGDSAAAEEQLRAVVTLEPENLAIRHQLALFLASQKRTDDAEQTLKEAIGAVADSDADAARLAYVDFLTAQRSPQEGEQALREFIAGDPEDYDLQLGLGALQQRVGSTEEAVGTYRRIIEADDDGPGGLTARNRIAAIRVVEGRFDDAFRLVGEVLERNPRDNDALVLRGNIALEREDATTAIADLRAVLRDQPGAVGVLRSLARAHLANGEVALAEESLRNAMAAAPNDAPVRVELAQLLAQTGRAEQAATLLEDAVRSAPTDAGAREALVRAYISNQDFDAARVAAEDLKTLRPDAAVGAYLAGVVAQLQNRIEDSRRELQHALELQPSAMDALAALVRLEVSTGRNERAMTHVRAAIQREPDNGVAHNLLGELYLASRQYGDAAAEFERATTLAPKWWLPYRNLAMARIASNDQDAGITAYERGIERTGPEATLTMELAALYERRGRIDDAIARYEALHERNPGLDLAANNLAMLLVTYKTDQPSLDRARDLTARFASSDNSALLDTHGWVRLKRGELQEALTALERAADKAPQSKVIRYHLAMAQLEAGQRDEAVFNLEAAVSGEANFAGVDEARSTLAELTGRAG